MFHRSRLALAGLLVLFVSLVPLAAGTPSVLAATLNVCGHCKYKTIQSALKHASNGDVIRVGAGTYHGPITINTSVKLIGAGSTSTVIRGGGKGPVVEIGADLSGPAVSISDVTVTGGRNTSVPEKFQPAGGGIRVESGATATLNNSLITANSVRSLGAEPCGSITCSRALGGGIANYGYLTLNHSTVSNNSLVNLDAHADLNGVHGGGIYSAGTGGLTLNRTTVAHNSLTLTRAAVSTDSALAGVGGGIETAGSSVLTIKNSTIKANRVIESTTTKNQTGQIGDLGPNGGGIAMGGPAATITGSRIDGNSLSMTAYTGNASADTGGIIAGGGTLRLVSSEVNDNHVRVTVTSAQSNASATAGSSAFHSEGPTTIKDTKFIGNSEAATGSNGSMGQGILSFFASQPVTIVGSVVSHNSGRVTATSGSAFAWGGIFSNLTSLLTISRSRITGNALHVSAGSGTATIQGVGITNGSGLDLESTVVSKNTGRAVGSAGTAQGGGIWNGDNGNGPASLNLVDSSVTHNDLSASNAKIKVQGGGLFTTAHVNMTKTTIAHNVPDECFGC
jgi:hypothetical protein